MDFLFRQTPDSGGSNASSGGCKKLVSQRSVCEAELDAIFGLVRLQHLSASFLAGIVPQIDWFWARILNGCSGSDGAGATVSHLLSPIRQLMCHLRAAKVMTAAHHQSNALGL